MSSSSGAGLTPAGFACHVAIGCMHQCLCEQLHVTEAVGGGSFCGLDDDVSQRLGNQALLHGQHIVSRQQLVQRLPGSTNR